MRTRILTTLIFLAVCCIATAQVNQRPGYIITNRNDTIQGMIDFRTAERNGHVCDFYSAATQQKETFYPGDIYAYRFTDDGKFYVTRTITLDRVTQKLFLEYLIKGVVSLYYYKAEASRFFFENEEGQMIEAVEEIKEIAISSGAPAIRTNKQYIGVMTWLFQKSDKVMQKIPKLALSKEELSRITKEYHYDTCDTGEQCIEFENKPDKHFFKLLFTVSAGVRIHTFKVDQNIFYWRIGTMKSISPSMTLSTNITIPRIGQSIGLQAEVELSKLVCQKDAFTTGDFYHKVNIDALVSDVRLGLRFRPFKGKIYPVIEGGGSYSKLWGLSADLSTQRIISSQFYEDESEISQGITKNFFGYYATAGLVINLPKNSLIIQGLYKQSTRKGDRLSTWGASLGYSF